MVDSWLPQTLLGVILDHILYVSSEPSTNTLLPTLVTHLTSLSKTYPIKSAEAFVSKLTLMQKNLVRGLQAPLETSSRTFPGTAELMLLKVLGETWSTSDMKHPVVGPARYLMASYLGLGRIRSVKDLASGMFLCTLFLDVSACPFFDLSHLTQHPAVRTRLKTLRTRDNQLSHQRRSHPFSHGARRTTWLVPLRGLPADPYGGALHQAHESAERLQSWQT